MSHFEPPETWLAQAACVNFDPSLFFSDGHNEIENRRNVVRAKAICASCPVKAECLAYARKTRQQYGVWGGVDRSVGKGHRGEVTECVSGHKFTPENTRLSMRSDGGTTRRCIACDKRRTYERHQASRVSE